MHGFIVQSMGGALALLALAACGGGESAQAATDSSSTSPAPRWSVDYEGDTSGRIQGDIMTVGGTSMTVMAAGVAMAADMRSTAPEGMRFTIMALPEQEPRLAKVDLTLPDGAACRLNPDREPQVSVISREKDSFHVTMNGDLRCDGNQAIRFRAQFQER